MSRAYHHGNLREVLVDTAFAMAREGGPSAVVLRAVSRTAGVSHNAAYRHFADHEQLLAAVSERCMAELAALMMRRTDEVIARGATRRAWARLRAIGRAYVEFARTEPGWFRTAFVGCVPDVDAATVSSSRNPYLLLSERLDELVAVGALPPARRPGAEYATWSGVHGLSCLLVDGPLRSLPDAEVDVAVQIVLDVATRGL